MNKTDNRFEWLPTQVDEEKDDSLTDEEKRDIEDIDKKEEESTASKPQSK